MTPFREVAAFTPAASLTKGQKKNGDLLLQFANDGANKTASGNTRHQQVVTPSSSGMNP
jgi:hypothetical protein